ncbi:MAG TPA: hypothetical protein VMP68_33130 [Candidatus Eisenbacteria bacterium]|nr:hypothetical protein [Candidatus Eisenbacteria bacterium]
MMDAKTLSLLVESCLCIFLIAFVLLKFWAEARLDSFRQKMFALRDELFDFAADGNIGFADEAYRLLRQSMNGTIRYAHQLTFFRVCMTMAEIEFASLGARSDWSADWQRALGTISDRQVREKMEAFHGRSMQLVIERLVLGSPLLLGFVLLTVPFVALRLGWLNLKTMLSRASLLAVPHLVNTRLIENEAAAAAIG